MNKVLDSMAFSKFIHERGTPFRVCDIFDEVRRKGLLMAKNLCMDPALVNDILNGYPLGLGKTDNQVLQTDFNVNVLTYGKLVPTIFTE